MAALILLVTHLLLSAFVAGVPVNAASNDTFSGVAGKCIDVRGGKAQLKNKIQIYSCNNTRAQQWDVPGDGTIRNQGMCLDVRGGNKASKTYVQLYTCNKTKSQQWSVNADGSVTSTLSGLCLDNSNGNAKNTNPLWVYSCNSSKSQKWSSTTIRDVATAEASRQAAIIEKQKNEEAAKAAEAARTAAAAEAARAAEAQRQAEAQRAQSQSINNGYTNSSGNYVQSPSDNPQGASAKCQDGTYSYSQSRRGTCSHHGGVAIWY